MNPESLDDNTIRRYLLGFGDDLEQQQVEEALLLDEAGRRQIAIVEDELIDQYLAAELNRAEIAAFESHFLAPRSRREHLRFAKALQQYIKDHPEAAKVPSRNAWFTMPRFALAAAVLALAAAAWLALSNRPSVPLQTAQNRPASVEESKNAPQTFILALSPGLLRSGGGEPAIETRPALPSVEIHLALPQETSGFASYSATLATVEGREVWHQSGLQPESGSIRVVIPTSSLSRGDWRVALSGTSSKGKLEAVSNYYFRASFD